VLRPPAVVWYGGRALIEAELSAPERSEVDMDVSGGEMEFMGESSRSS